MKERFLEQFNILAMTKSSLRLEEKRTGRIVYIHRKAFNALEDATDYRITQQHINGLTTDWIEVLIWKVL
jgi:hypothetical protein